MVTASMPEGDTGLGRPCEFGRREGEGLRHRARVMGCEWVRGLWKDSRCDNKSMCCELVRGAARVMWAVLFARGVYGGGDGSVGCSSEPTRRPFVDGGAN